MLVHSWLNPKCQARQTSTGRGVYAKHVVQSGERIAILAGHVMPADGEPVFSGHGDYAIQIAEEFVLGSKYEHELEDTDFFNHCCDANAGFRGQIFLVAMRDIQPDSEIRFDYAMCLHAVHGRAYELACTCGSPLCRGRVTTNDWMLPALQKRYDGWFQTYLQEKVNALKRETESPNQRLHFTSLRAENEA